VFVSPALQRGPQEAIFVSWGGSVGEAFPQRAVSPGGAAQVRRRTSFIFTPAIAVRSNRSTPARCATVEKGWQSRIRQARRSDF
jgi:hypothetical protein